MLITNKNKPYKKFKLNATFIRNVAKFFSCLIIIDSIFIFFIINKGGEYGTSNNFYCNF